jgi:hypothetical protein
MLSRYATFDVVTEKLGESTGTAGEPMPVGKTTADFIKAIVPYSFQMPEPPPILPSPVVGSTGFKKVTPGTRVSFQVRAHNDFVPATGSAQIFRAKVKVLAGGCTDLDTREVLILVPPNPITAI